MKMICHNGLECSVLSITCEALSSNSRSDISNLTKYNEIFLRRLTLSRFLVKTVSANISPMKNFSKICRSESSLNYRSHHSCIKINKHNKSGVRNYYLLKRWPIMYLCNSLKIFKKLHDNFIYSQNFGQKSADRKSPKKYFFVFFFFFLCPV